MEEKKGFVPPHFGRELSSGELKYRGEIQKAKTPEKRVKAHRQMIEARDRMLEEVPDLSPDLRQKAVSKFIELLKDSRTAQRAFRQAKEAKEKRYWAEIFTRSKKELEEFLSDQKQNLQLEKAYRKWAEGRSLHRAFLQKEAGLYEVEKKLAEPAFSGEVGEFSEQNLARLERMSERAESEADLENQEVVDALKYLYTEKELGGGEGQAQYEALVSELTSEEPQERKLTKAELEREKQGLEQKLNQMWEEEPQIQYHEAGRQLDKLLGDVIAGKDVYEMPSVITNLNTLADWEEKHKRTTVGGVLVGPPGTGKTTLVHHYLEERGRNYVYLDFSEEVTRYTLFGTKALEFKSVSEYYSELTNQIARLSDVELKKFIQEHGKTVAETYHLSGEEAEAAFFQMLNEEIGKAEKSGEKIKELEAAKDKLLGKVGELYRKELASKFKHLVQKNGWRDGVLIAALRRGDSVICDEFTKMRDLSLIYGLITSKPGEKWYFADNDERIEIPETWRMYFTANIGRKHGGYKVAEALASRAQGKVMEISYPPANEELTVALAGLCDAEGGILRSKEDVAKTLILTKDAFPKIRTLLEGKEATIPISWRTIRDIGEKLIKEKEAYGQKIRQRTSKTFDQAIYEVLAESYRIYEDKTVPKEIVNLCTSLGLMLDEDLKKKIVDRDGYLTEEEFYKRQEIRDAHQMDWEEIVKEIKGERAMEAAFLTEERPVRRLYAVK